MRVLLRPVGGKRRLALQDLGSVTYREIETIMERDVKPVLLKSHQAVVAGFDHPIEFQVRKFIKPDSLSLTCFPVGEYAYIWNILDQGAKPHRITAKVAPRLLYPRGPYISKTLAKPARVDTGGGVYVDSSLVSAQSVNHPGSEAREFTKQIAEDIKPSYKKAINAGFDRVARTMRK